MTDEPGRSGSAARRLPADLDAWRAIAERGACCNGNGHESLYDLLAQSTDPDAAAEGEPSKRPAPEATVLDSDAILAGARKVAIRHRGDLYTLQVTRQGKLLLTK